MPDFGKKNCQKAFGGSWGLLRRMKRKNFGILWDFSSFYLVGSEAGIVVDSGKLAGIVALRSTS